MKKLFLFALLAVLLIGCFASCQENTGTTQASPAKVTSPTQVASPTETASPTQTATPAQATATPTDTKVQTEQSTKLMFTIKTNKGVIKGELYPSIAPNTVLNFVTLARQNFYNDILFHRVVPGFVVQAGDPYSKSTNPEDLRKVGSGGPGYSIPAEFSNKPHVLGTLSMARSQHPDSAGSQFYIVIGTENVVHLNGQYTVFGQVTEGMPVALSIEQGDKIESIEITGELPADLKGKEIKKSGVR